MSLLDSTSLTRESYDTSASKQEVELVSNAQKNKYGITVYQYPSDLGSAELQHYIEFAINVRGKSKFDKNKRLFEITKNPDSANLSSDQIAGAAATSVGIAGAAVGAGVAKKIAGKFGLTGAKEKVATVAGAATGYSAGSAIVNANTLLKPDTTYRISDVIALYIDGPPSVRYSMNYTNKELGTLAGLLSGGIIESLGALNPASEKGAAAITALAKLPGMFSSVDAQAALSAASKTSLNPFKEVIFESVDFRSFAFKYKFYPKSYDEALKVYDIIKLFKFHMHPELSENKLFFIYPSEFQITYYFGSQKNPYFHKMAPCVLENVDVTYGGEQFSSFSDGFPTEINMNLVFRETEILTKNMINQGY